MNRPLWTRIDPGASIGRTLHGYGEVTSTMDVAWELVDAGAPHGTAVMAEQQTRGRGRFGRPWISDPGASLSLSVVLMPPPPIAPLVSVIAGVAVRSAVRELAGLEASIKWPNDLHAGGRKLCGILAEGRASTDARSVMVLGAGLNLDLDVDRRPELRETATSLRAETGSSHPPTDAAVMVLRHLEAWYRSAVEGRDVLAAWRQALDTLGRRVTVRSRDGGTVTGVAESVDDTGRLVVRMEDGGIYVAAEGDVSVVPPPS